MGPRRGMCGGGGLERKLSEFVGGARDPFVTQGIVQDLAKRRWYERKPVKKRAEDPMLAARWAENETKKRALLEEQVTPAPTL